MQIPSLLNIMLSFALCVCTVVARGQLGESFYHLGVSDGLANDRVYHSLQDREGFMWFATESGLSRYDGYQFQNFTVEKGISKNEVHRLYKGRADSMWVLTRVDLAVKAGDDFTIIDTIPRIREKRVLSLLQDSAANMWLTTNENVNLIRPSGNHSHFKKEDFGSPTMPIMEFVEGSGQVWLSAENNFFIMEDSVVKERIRLDYPVRGAGVSFTAAILLSSGEVLYSSTDGLVLMDTTRSQYLSYQPRIPNFKSEDITALLTEAGNRFWISSKQNGVLLLQRSGRRLSLVAHLLNGIGVNHMQLDAEGNLWVSTQNDGIYLRSRNASAITSIGIEGLLDTALAISTTDHDNNLWLASQSGLFIRVSEGRAVQQIDISPTLKEGEYLRAFEVLLDGTLLVGTNEGLIWRKSPVDISRYSSFDRIMSIRQSPDGELLISSVLNSYRCQPSALAQFEDPVDDPFLIVDFEEVAGLNPPLQYLDASHILVDYDSTIWVSFIGGFVHLVGQEQENLSELHTVFRTRVLSLQQHEDSSIWVGTNGSGLVILKEDTFRIINSADGLPGEVINDIFFDGKSSVWIATNNGLGKIEEFDFGKRDFSITGWYNRKDGLLDANVLAVTKQDGEIYAVTRRGISRLREADLDERQIKPPVYIMQVKVNQEVYDWQLARPLSYQQNSIEIQFTGLSFSNPGSVRYRYKLEGGKGSDELWQETDQTSLTYAGLSPGTYSFHVVAVNQEGIESQRSARFQFVIEPPVYQRPWFLGLLALLFVLVIFLLLRYFYLNQQRTHLQRLVDEKTAALNENLNELTRANRELEQFAYAASHDLKTPLRTVIGHLQLLEKRYKGKLDTDADEFIAFAVGGAKKMNVMINDLLNYAKVGRQKLKFVEVDLNQTLASVQRMLSIVIDKPNVTVEVAELPTIRGIPTQWELLFQNLIENGLKFNHSDHPHIKVHWEDAPDFWRIYVADNGIGIAEEYQAKIFELFQRLHTTEFPGTGIGLAMCKKIAELHNGSIYIESEVGKGTTFCITIAKRL